MAITKACSTQQSIKNTGFECSTAMLALAMIIAIDPDVEFDEDDLEDDPIEWIKNLIHERKAFPMFGQKAPITDLNNDQAADIIVELDNGLKVFLRYGVYNRNLKTTAGGLCYAASLMSFLQSGYKILEIDIVGKMMARKNLTGTFSGLITDFMYSPAPVMADLKTTPYKNGFSYSYTPEEVVQNGIIFDGARAFLSMIGLIDVKFTVGDAGAGSTTKLKFHVDTECKEDDLLVKFPTDIIDVSNYIVKNKATGAVISISAGAIVGTHLELTGTFVSGQIYTIIGSAPTVWRANDIEGYDASATGQDLLEILIP